MTAILPSALVTFLQGAPPMLYPRTDSNGHLVEEAQMVSVREHLTQKHRILFFSGTFSGETESCNTLLALDSLNHDPIKIVINSPGGYVDPALIFYDTIRMLRSPVITIGRMVASAAVVLLVAGEQRYLLPHSKVMLHLVAGGFEGDLTATEIHTKEMRRYQDVLIDILVERGVKKPRRQILRDIQRDFWLTAQEAVDYGLADGILTAEQMRGWLAND